MSAAAKAHGTYREGLVTQRLTEQGHGAVPLSVRRCVTRVTEQGHGAVPLSVRRCVTRVNFSKTLARPHWVDPALGIMLIIAK
jgi:hypothetical protein